MLITLQGQLKFFKLPDILTFLNMSRKSGTLDLSDEARETFVYFENGAIIYVCGDGSKMEPDVKAALVAIYRERKSTDAEAGLRWIDDLGTENRYVLDVWAGG